jgi:hypothetical protein
MWQTYGRFPSGETNGNAGAGENDGAHANARGDDDMTKAHKSGGFGIESRIAACG